MKLTMSQLHWQIGSELIPYFLGYDCFHEAISYIVNLNSDVVFIITDNTVNALYGQQLKSMLEEYICTELVAIESGEAQKTLACLDSLASQMLSFGVTRNSTVVALGGGVIGNIGGMLAALLFRGIRLIHIPTTLLAMHDSVTSIKQALNYGGVKNILGTYYAPTFILADLATLHSLPALHVRSGLFELIKNGLIMGGSYLDRLRYLIPLWMANDPEVWYQLIKMGVEAKSCILQQDPKERYQGIVFEYGHTVGHALELAYDGSLTHGEAIAWGMRCASQISWKLGYMSDPAFEEHESVLQMLGSLHAPQSSPAIDAIIAKIHSDNKRGYVEESKGKIPMILLKEPSNVVGSLSTHFLTLVPVEIVYETIMDFGLVH